MLVPRAYSYYGSGFGTGSVTPGHTPASSMRGASGNGDGVHILTGPIYVTGAVPGDVIAVTIDNLQPRVNPAMNATFGINAAVRLWLLVSVGLASDLHRAADSLFVPHRTSMKCCCLIGVVGLQLCVSVALQRRRVACRWPDLQLTTGCALPPPPPVTPRSRREWPGPQRRPRQGQRRVHGV